MKVECALCGDSKLPEGETIKGRFQCTCGREWILEKRKIHRISNWNNTNSFESRNSFILDCLSIFNSTLDITNLIHDFSELIHRKMGKKNIGILLIDMDRSKIETASFKSGNSKIRRFIKKIKFNYDMSVGVLIKSMTESRSIYYNFDTESHPFYKFYQKLTNTNSQLIIPILYGNSPLGLITIDYPNKDEVELEEDRETLELITGQFAVALRNSHLYERSKRQSLHFQNLHLSALTLSKLYLDKHEEMIKMILLTASSFVDSKTNCIYEYNPNNNPKNEYQIYRLTKDHSSGLLNIDISIAFNWDDKIKEFPQNGFKEKQLYVRFTSENNSQYTFELIQDRLNFTRDDFEVINAFAALSKITIDNTLLYESLSSKKIFEREIEIAKEIQLTLLPSEFPEFPGYNFAGIMEAARGVGGDYYDIIVSPDRTEVIICIGDVSGKGVGAGMVMATVRTILHSLVRRKPSNRELLQDINTYLYYNYCNSSTPRFMTMTLISWHPDSNEFYFAGAGQGSLFHYQSGLDRVIEIETHGLILGIGKSIDSNIYESKVELKKGDSLLLFTDGVTESMNPNGEAFEESNLMKSFLMSDKSSSKSILSSILGDVQSFIGTREQHDDLTMVCIQSK